MKYSGPFFNKAMNLYRKIIGDTQFVNEIKYLDLNSESLNSEQDIDLEGVDEESDDFKIIHFTKKQRFDKKSNICIFVDKSHYVDNFLFVNK